MENDREGMVLHRAHIVRPFLFCLLIGVKCGFSFVLLLEMGTAGNVIT